MDDCNVALAVDADCFRAYVVRCMANIYLSNFSQALDDHAGSISRSGGNVVLLERLEELRGALDAARSAALYAATRGSSAAVVADWIGDFNLLGLEGTDGAKRRRESMQGLPKLIPIGEWMGSDVCELFLDYTSYKLTDKAMKEKQRGNAEFAGGNFARALQLYTRAIKLNPEEALFYSNRALVYIRMQRFEEAVSDCSASIARQPTIKAYARRALAYDSLGMHAEAAHDHRAALQFEPRNPVCLNSFRECLEVLTKLPGVSEEERARAQRELDEVVSMGHLTSGSDNKGASGVSEEGGLSLSSSTVETSSMMTEKKKRGAGGL